MTEQEWLECADPHTLLSQLQHCCGRRMPSRKMRLFLCACCRFVWELAPPLDNSFSVDVIEGYADGQTPINELNATRQSIKQYRASSGRRIRYSAWLQAIACAACAKSLLWDAVHQQSKHLVEVRISTALKRDEFNQSHSEWKAQEADGKRLKPLEYRNLCTLIHDIFGNPFRPVAINPAWLAWNDGTVRKIAQGIYDDRAFDRLPILADALQDAGCDNADLLNHCRSEGPHVKGCWAVDALLGKE